MTGLEDAKLRFTTDIVLPSGGNLGTSIITIPLASYAADKVSHITIRLPGDRFENPRFGGPLEPGDIEILTDHWFPSVFTDTGMYTFKVEGYLPGSSDQEVEKYLFCMQYSQWLEGRGW